MSYRSVRAQKSPASYREFLFRNPNHPKAKEIRRLLDEADFQEASQLHTAPAYRRYLEQHPSGNHFRQAKFLAERIAYYDALSQMRPDQFRQYLKQFPGGKYASEAQEKLQRAEFAEVRKKDKIGDYSRFLARYRNRRSEWTAAAQQRLERLLLDAAVAYNDPKALADFIQSHPTSPYHDEAKRALKKVSFERLLSSNDLTAMAEFVERYQGEPEGRLVSQRMEEVMLRTAEQTGRARDLDRFLRQFPSSSYRERVATALSLMTRKRDQEVNRWIKVRNGEIEVVRPRRCRSCDPVLKVSATVLNQDPDFAFDLVLRSELNRKGKRCCQVTQRVHGLRPGEARAISFDVPGKVPPGPPPAFDILIVKGRSYFAGGGEKGSDLKRKGEKPPRDRFAPKSVPPLGR